MLNTKFDYIPDVIYYDMCEPKEVGKIHRASGNIIFVKYFSSFSNKLGNTPQSTNRCDLIHYPYKVGDKINVLQEMTIDHSGKIYKLKTNEEYTITDINGNYICINPNNIPLLFKQVKLSRTTKINNLLKEG